MEPVSMIVSALAAGALAKSGEVAGKVVLDTYAGLKKLIADRYSRGGGAQAVEEDPRSEHSRKALEVALVKSGAAEDRELLEFARRLSEALQAQPQVALESVGVRIGELRAMNARFAEIDTAGGTGLEIGSADVNGDFEIGRIRTKSPN